MRDARLYPILIVGIALSVVLACRQNPAPAASASTAPAGASQAKTEPVMDLPALQAEVTRLKGLTPSASVAMADVGFHFSNLWFAAGKQNWPLATFYYNETRNHIRWMIRINPMPKGPDGNPVDVQGIFDGIDTSTLKALKDVIDKKDSAQFPVVYRQMLEACYSCHKSVGRPYLRPQVPTTPPQTIINLDPAANWPS